MESLAHRCVQHLLSRRWDTTPQHTRAVGEPHPLFAHYWHTLGSADLRSHDLVQSLELRVGKPLTRDATSPPQHRPAGRLAGLRLLRPRSVSAQGRVDSLHRHLNNTGFGCVGQKERCEWVSAVPKQRAV